MATSTNREPTTPTLPDEVTPQLSSASPDTPTKKGRGSPTILQTPVSRMKGYSRIGVGVKPDHDPSADIPSAKTATPTTDATTISKEVEGLGYEIELDGEDQIDVEAVEMDRGEGSSSSSTNVVLGQAHDSVVATPILEEVEETEERDIEFPSTEVMQGMSDRLDAGGMEQADLAEMAKTLLIPCMESLPLLRDQLEAQRATIRTMQEQARLAVKLSEIERDRHTAERTGWHREMKALVIARDAEIAAGKRPRKGLDLDVGYHQELEASNKRLEMDNRLMAPRLADTQRQIDKLVNELRHLRSNVIMSTSTIAPTPHPDQQSHRHRRRTPSPTRAVFNTTTMGDARTEHLLLAARKVRTMRASNANVGMMTLAELKRNGVVGPEGGIGYSEGYAGHFDSESDELESEEEEDRKPVLGRTPGGRGKQSQSQSTTNTPLLPRAKKGSKQTFPAPPTTPRSKKSAQQQQQQQQPLTTPGGSNFSDLLRAAELATRPQTPRREQGAVPAPIPMSAMSATRTRMREESVSERGSPVKKSRRVGEAGSDNAGFPSETMSMSRMDSNADVDAPNTGSAQEDSNIGLGTLDEASALDLLAQASQLEVAQASTPDELQEVEGEDEIEQESDIEEIRIKAELDIPGSNGQGHARQSSHGSALEPPIDLRPTPSQGQDQSLVESNEPQPQNNGIVKTPLNRPRKLSDVHTPSHPHVQGHGVPATDPPLALGLGMGAFASPTGGTVPGLGKYVHLSSSMPARRVRSPYLKWTIEEDELLARAVAIHGEKWDLVSKGVPTRSYHQVRQRWLRKTGAFDKKQLAAGTGTGTGTGQGGGGGMGGTAPSDHHGSSGLGLGMPISMGMGMGMGMDAMMEDEGEGEGREGSPTPQSGAGAGRGKKRKESEVER